MTQYENGKMKAAVFRKIGPAEEVVNVESIGRPLVADVTGTKLVIQVHAGAMNPVNYKIVQGMLGFLTPKLPATDGIDVSGVVVAAGPGCKRIKVGDEVWGKAPAPTRFGTFAEYALVPEDCVCIKPASLSHVEAGSLGIVALTGYQALLEIGSLKEGDKILILGGSGGTGTFGIQLAKHVCKAYVATTCSERNVDLVKSLGADQVINYREENWFEVLAGADYDYVYDCRGGATHWEDSKKILKSTGHFITIAGDHASQPDIGLGSLLSTGFSIIGRKLSTLFSGPTYSYLINLTCTVPKLEAINKMIEEGQVKCIIDSVVPLDDIKKAYERQKSGRAQGKVVVAVVPPAEEPAAE